MSPVYKYLNNFEKTFQDLVFWSFINVMYISTLLMVIDLKKLYFVFYPSNWGWFVTTKIITISIHLYFISLFFYTILMLCFVLYHIGLLFEKLEDLTFVSKFRLKMLYCWLYFITLVFFVMCYFADQFVMYYIIFNLILLNIVVTMYCLIWVSQIFIEESAI